MHRRPDGILIVIDRLFQPPGGFLIARLRDPCSAYLRQRISPLLVLVWANQSRLWEDTMFSYTTFYILKGTLPGPPGNRRFYRDSERRAELIKVYTMNNGIKAFYDATAQSTADEWYPNDLLLPTIADFISLLPEKPLVLDLGCGPGHESKRLSKAGAIVTGIDFSEECIDIAKQRSPECNFIIGDIRSLNTGIGIFDGIFACASLIHIPMNELSIVLKNINSLLGKSGCLNIIILDGVGVSEKFSNLEFEGKKYNRIVYLYSKDVIINEAARQGFSFVREGFLEEELKESGWRNYLFKK